MSATATCRTPRSLSQITVPSPMGPAPKTTTLSAVRACERPGPRRLAEVGGGWTMVGPRQRLEPGGALDHLCEREMNRPGESASAFWCWSWSCGLQS
jgi:hypothetical protein